MKCKICQTSTNKSFSSTILNKYLISYYHCPTCNFLQTEEPYWLEEAYHDSINISDTGYMLRNIQLSKKLTILLFFFFNKNMKYLDYAGGYGVFVRLMRDIGFDFYWDDKYTQNLFARGFEHNQNNTIEAVTTFESFEHFVNPLEEIEKLLTISRNIIFSTEILPASIPNPEQWWYYGLEHGQHISFYSLNTFNFLAKQYHLNYINLGSLHLLTEKNISLFKLKLLSLHKIGLHKFLQWHIQSKMWTDHLKMSNKQ